MADQPTYKLGKAPAVPGAVKLKLSDYLDTAKLPKLPQQFGHAHLIKDWGMFGNDKCGDCAFAGAYHETMLWNAEAGKTVRVDDRTVVGQYSAFTGYDPSKTNMWGENPSDQGTIVTDLIKHRATVGLPDADGKMHKIGAYVALEPGNLTELWYATYLFDGVGVGVSFPEEWMTAFNNGQPWDRVQKPTPAGGHYICGVSQVNNMLGIVTWGRLHWMTPAGYQQFNDESYAYLSEERLAGGHGPGPQHVARDINGFNLAQLRADIAEITKQ